LGSALLVVDLDQSPFAGFLMCSHVSFASSTASPEYTMLEPTSSFRQRFTVQNVGTETLLYDEIRHKAFCLNQVSGLIWKFAAKSLTVKQLAEATSSELQHPVSEEIVRFALADLHRDGLLETRDELQDAHIPSRRALVRKLGAGAVLMMPLVTAIFAPTPAYATSHVGGGCLLPDTLVSLWDGSEIAAGAVQPHQRLRGIDPETGQSHSAEVVSCHSFYAEQLLTFFTASGEMVKSSPAHLFIAGAGDLDGTKASAFRAGDSIMVFDRAHSRALHSTITAIQVSQIPQRVVNLELGSAAHTFVSAGIISHNKIVTESRPGPDPAFKPLF
jgi:hypothetical protein